MNLPQAFLNRMKERLGSNFPAFLASYEKPSFKGLRVNTLKISREEFRKISPFALEPIPWAENGFYITEEKPGADVYHFAGLYYMQEPSAMCAAPLLGVKPGERVLDLCAAPGGKTTQLAADMQGEGILIANEIDRERAKILSQNVERMGITNCVVTCFAPDRLAEKFPSFFDKILVDAPCSGEGMFKKEPEALTHWSEANVRLCAARQKDILECAAKMLAGGGELVYSTCTFAEEEDEWQVTGFLSRHPELELIEMKKLLPHEIEGEGHFAAHIRKREGDRWACREIKTAKNRAVGDFLNAFLEEKTEPLLYEYSYSAAGAKRYFSLPEETPDISALRLGVELGEWDGKVFKPAHALAMALGSKAKHKVKLTREEAKTYLRGETLNADIENGWAAVCVEEFPLGLGKAVNGTIKNHLPKGLRMLK